MVAGVLAALKKWLRRLLLRGAVLDWWVARRGKQWETAYVGELVRGAATPLAPITPPRRTSPTDQLRNILLIADCMWEQNDLVPEFEKIAPTQLLNLRPLLKGTAPGPQQSAVVAEAVRAYGRDTSQPLPDVILFYARPGLLSEEVFHALRQRWSCPLLGMNLDDKLQFFPYGIFRSGDDNYQQWAKQFDLNITNCLPATDWYRQRGLSCLYSPQGVYRPAGMQAPSSADFKYEFSFLGSIKPERKLIVERLGQAGININLFGAGWPNTQWVDDPNAVFRGTQINLGIGFASPSLSLTTVKGRDFECVGVGACYLTTYNWELPLHYELGKEILCYRSIEELVEMYSYYRRRPDECLKIAQAAWRRCTAEHTWELRFRRIFREVGFRV